MFVLFFSFLFFSFLFFLFFFSFSFYSKKQPFLFHLFPHSLSTPPLFLQHPQIKYQLWSGTLKRSTSPSPSRKGVSNIFSEPIGEHLDLEGSGSNSPLLTPISPKSGKKKPKTLGRKSGKKASPLSPLQSDISLSFTKDLSEKFIHVDVGGAGGGETAPLPRGDCFTPNGDPTNIRLIFFFFFFFWFLFLLFLFNFYFIYLFCFYFSILEMREQANEKVEGKYFQSRLERLLDALKAKNGGQLNPCPCITASIVPRVCDESNIPVKLQVC